MAFSNLGFEDPNSSAPGLPADWTVSSGASTAQEAADYDDGDTSSVLNRSVEAFEGAWDSNEDFVFAYVQPDDPAELEAGIYDDALPDSEDHENFEEGWSSNEDFLTQMGSAEAASYDGNVFRDSDPETYALADGDTLSIQTDIGVGTSEGLDAGTRAQHTADDPSDGPPPGYDAGGEIVHVIANGRATVDVTLDDGDLDVNDVAAKINSAATAQGHATELTAGTTGVPAKLFIRSDVEGYASSIEITQDQAGTWEKTGYSASQIGTGNGSTGTGDVALIDAALAADMVTFINNDANLTGVDAEATETLDSRIRVFGPAGGSVKVFTTSMGSKLGFDGTTDFADNSAEAVEDLEEGWSSNEDFLFAWDTGSEDAASYDPVTGPEDHEDFEEEWQDNHNFHTDIGAPTAAVYDDGAEPVEDFEEISERQLVTVDPSTDKIERAGHGLIDGEKVTFENEDGRLPEGLSARAVYFVVNATTDDFKVSATSGGSAVDITDAGLGSHFVLRDPNKFWIDFMETL